MNPDCSSERIAASASWKMLLEQAVRRPDSRALCTAGISRAISMPMIVITTSSSTSVKAVRRPAGREADQTMEWRDMARTPVRNV